MGIRKKVTLGFICLSILLVGAGAVSYFELSHIEKHTRRLLDESTAEMAASRQKLERALDDYEKKADNYFSDIQFGNDSLTTSRLEAWQSLVSATGDYMAETETDLGTQAANIEHDAYRAITPSLVTLGVVLLLLAVLLYFIDLYYIKPVVKMSRSLEGFVKHNSPFNVTFEGSDEVFQLKEHILKLIDTVKKKQS